MNAGAVTTVLAHRNNKDRNKPVISLPTFLRIAGCVLIVVGMIRWLG